MENLINCIIFITMAFCFITGLVMLFSALRAFSTWQLIRDLPTIPISKVSRGMFEVKGKAVDEQRGLVSPISEKPCVYYHVVVEERSGRSWKTQQEKSDGSPVIIDDGTAKARIPLRDAAVDFKLDLGAQVNSWFTGDSDFVQLGSAPGEAAGSASKADESPQAVRRYLTELNLIKDEFGEERDVRCLETYILPGDELYVLGYGVKEDGVITFSRKKSHPYVVSDRCEGEVARTYFYVWQGYVVAGVCFFLMFLGVIARFFNV